MDTDAGGRIFQLLSKSALSECELRMSADCEKCGCNWLRHARHHHVIHLRIESRLAAKPTQRLFLKTGTEGKSFGCFSAFFLRQHHARHDGYWR